MDTFESWLGQLPQEEIEADLRRLEGERAELEAEIETRRLALALVNRRHPPSDVTPPTEAEQSVPPHPDRPMPSVAVVELVANEPSRNWGFGEVMQELIRRGWATDSLSERRRIQAAISRLLAKGQLVRLESGSYQVPPPPDSLGRPWVAIPTGFTRFNKLGDP